MDTREKYLRQLRNLFWENGFIPEDNQLERLANFAHLLAKKNNNLNLISKKEINSIVEKHIFISAYLYIHT